MLRRTAMAGANARSVSRSPARALGSIACLAFVALLASAFWAGALWIGRTLLILLAGA